MSELGDWIRRDPDGVREALDDLDLDELAKTIDDCDRQGKYEGLGMLVLQRLQCAEEDWREAGEDYYQGCSTYRRYGACPCSTGDNSGPCGRW